jgi:hypothetical protein
LEFELLFELLLLLAQLLLNLLEEAGLGEVELLGLLAGHHELPGVLLMFVLLLGLTELGRIRELVEALLHQLRNFWTEFLSFLVPAPLVDLGLAQA